MRDKTTINRLRMYKNFKAKRDRRGKITIPAPFQTTLTSGSVARIAPNQKWFGNTKVIGQNALQRFQEALGTALKDPYQVVMRQTKLPITLLNERAKNKRFHILDTEGFETTFGPKAIRKRPMLKTCNLEEFVNAAEESAENYDASKDKNLVTEKERKEAKEMIMLKGQSKRLWNELYKVIDSSDVVIQVLDARDPMGTRSKHIENFLRKEKPHKHLVFVLNKCDLVPTWVAQRWVTILSAEYPTMAFHASITNPFGKGALINLLRQFGKLHEDKKQISVGFIGYPNVGKSSIINTLRSKKVCNVAPIAGETKVWQYITLMRRIYLIDCPGVVYPTGDTDTEIVLKGVVRVENIQTPEDHIPEVLERVKKEYLQKTYKVESWTDPVDFLEQYARRSGKLLKGGEPDISTVAKMILNDFQRGKLPYFVKPPVDENKKESNQQEMTQAESNTSCESNSSENNKEGTEIEKGTTEVDASKGGNSIKLNLDVSEQDFSDLKVKFDFTEDDVQPFAKPKDVENSKEVEQIVEKEVEKDTVVKKVHFNFDEGVDENSKEILCHKDVENAADKATKEGVVQKIHFDFDDDVCENAEVSSHEDIDKTTDKDVKEDIAVKKVHFNLDDEVNDSEEISNQNIAMEKCVGRKPTKKRKIIESDEVDPPGKKKLTAKQRRRLMRAEKIKKIGVHFYDTANVKNRNRRKRQS
ncbi:nucleolar GTP-binding protein 2-like [Stegodyphus dumicola]|uniref:nucleolar GTP-binding protein 2-like n=1 Tax=Stegodyphus dumicola TaxID=202533 RepID=UPI0015AD3C86|nr:nucleolar GTP-binding protein 2-like [Stegodyphus dumicola]